MIEEEIRKVWETWKTEKTVHVNLYRLERHQLIITRTAGAARCAILCWTSRHNRSIVHKHKPLLEPSRTLSTISFLIWRASEHAVIPTSPLFCPGSSWRYLYDKSQLHNTNLIEIRQLYWDSNDFDSYRSQAMNSSHLR
jgi:hypothetical protein